MRIITEQNPFITKIKKEAGNRTVVLLEGEEDKFFFEKCWYRNNKDKYYFYECNGKDALITNYVELEKVYTLSNFFGIRDRDYDFSDEEVNQRNQDRGYRIFVLYKNTIENYLIQESAISQILDIDKGGRKRENEQSINGKINEIYGRLIYATAAILTIRELNRIIVISHLDRPKLTDFNEGHDINKITSLDEIIQELNKKIEIETPFYSMRTKDLINITNIQISKLQNLTNEQLDAYIQGKRFLSVLKKELNISGDDFRFIRGLADQLKDNIPLDIKKIFNFFENNFIP